MHTPPTPQIYRARYVYPIDQPPITDGAIIIDNHILQAVDTFASIKSSFSHYPTVDLGDVMLLPGFVNSHTHLALSHMRGKVPYSGCFVDWVRTLVTLRQTTETPLNEIIADAVDESISSGVTLVGDICYNHQTWPHLKKLPIRKTCFAEFFGHGHHLETQKKYLDECIATTQVDPLLKLGISPHAPYSVGRPLYELAYQYAHAHGLKITTHLAETVIEETFLKNGSGAWVDYLKEIDRWQDDIIIPHTTPVHFFATMARGGYPSLLAHVNYISDDDLNLLAKQQNVSVAYCPRTHQFFQHKNHRFAEMITRGINVCIGTDSLASNTTLSILDEIRFLHKHHQDFDQATLLQMATINGAKSLGFEKIVGTITKGKAADLTAIPIHRNANCPIEDLLTSNEQPTWTMINGVIV